MEVFMIKTGFYKVVVANEAEKWENTREEALKFRCKGLKAQVPDRTKAWWKSSGFCGSIGAHR